MVDWDLAVATAPQLVSPGPRSPRRGAGDRQPSCADFAGRGARSRGRLHPAGRPGRRRHRRSWSSTGPAGSRPTSSGFRRCSSRCSRRCRHEAASGPAAGRRRRRLKVTGVETGCCWRSWPTKVLGQYELFPPYASGPHRQAGPAAAGRAEHRHGRARDWASTRTTSGSGCACTRRPTARSSRAVPWLRDHIDGRDPVVPRRDRRRPGTRARAAQRRPRSRRAPRRLDPTPARAAAASLVEAVQTPRAAGDPGPAHRRDVPARGPRRLRDGRRRARRRPDASRRSGRSSSSAGASGASRLDQVVRAGCSAWTPSSGSTATASGSSAAWSTRSAWTASTGSGPRRTPSPPRRRSPTRGLGRAGAPQREPDGCPADPRSPVRGTVGAGRRAMLGNAGASHTVPTTPA